MYQTKELSKSTGYIGPCPPTLKKTTRRWSSTGTLFIDDTLHAPDSSLIISCVAATIHTIISTSRNKIYVNIFDERRYPLGDNKRNFERTPNTDEVIKFLELLCHRQELGPEVAVTACAYIDRLISYTGTSFTAYNWRRILLGAVLLADKVAEEDQVWNVDYKRSLPNLSITDLNALERAFLSLLRFDLAIKPSLYATYYFGLRAVAGSDGFPVQPMNLRKARSFEAKTTEKQEMARQKFGHLKRVNYKESLRPKISFQLFQKEWSLC